jgi:SAM-dependent methyltransferase
MRKKNKKDSRELGLEIGALCGKYFFRAEHLHYGLWANGLDVDISNLHIAQEKYTEYLLGHIPAEVRTILDVGCGAGKNARRMLDKAYRVDCVSPSSFLSERTAELLGPESTVFTCTYEQLQTDRQYDCVLFSESFQYVNLKTAIEQTIRLLSDGGYLLICDVFRNDIKGKSSISGGHNIRKFFEQMEQTSLEMVADEDITAETAPTIEILDDAMSNVAVPALDFSLEFLRGRYPLITGLLCWKYGKELAKVRDKYTNGRRTSEDFRKYKTYRLFLYKKPVPANMACCRVPEMTLAV